MRLRRFWPFMASLALGGWLQTVGAGSPSSGAKPPPRAASSALTTLEQVRHLTQAEAKLAHPVKAEGLVTYHDPGRGLLFVQDQSAGVAIAVDNPRPEVAVGDWVDVDGVTDWRGANPVLAKASLRVMRKAPLPKPHELSAAALATGSEHCQWVETTGQVRTARGQDGRSELLLLINGKRLPATVYAWPDAEFRKLAGAEVKLTGVCYMATANGGQAAEVRILVPSFSHVTVVKPAPADAFGEPLTAIASIQNLAQPGTAVQRVRVEGLVTRYEAGVELLVKDRTGATVVRTAQTNEMRLGTWVNVVGYPEMQEGKVILADASFRRIGYGPWLEAGKESEVVVPDPDRAGLPLMTDIEKIRDLSPEEAGRYYPVRVKGVITFYDAKSFLCFVQGASEGIYILTEEAPLDVKTGDRVMVEGVTGPGDFAPVILQPKITVTGTAPPPRAKPVSYADLTTGKEDCQWVEIEALVNAIRPEQHCLVLQLTADGKNLEAFIPDAKNERWPSQLVDTKVRLNGVCATQFNGKRQFVQCNLYLPTVACILTEQPPPDDPLGLAVRPVRSLLKFQPRQESGHRQLVHGVVTARLGDAAFYAQDESGGILVRSESPTPCEPGDLVAASGFPMADGYTPSLHHAQVLKRGRTSLPAPAEPPIDELWEGRHDGAFVQVKGRVVDLYVKDQQARLGLRVGEHYFEAVIYSKGGTLRALPLESLVQVRGAAAALITEQGEPRGCLLHVDSDRDVAVLERPSWWTTRRLQQGLFGGGLLSAAGVAWLLLLHRRVRAQTEVIRQRLEHEAAIEHRYEQLFENANDIVFTADLDGRFTSVNRAAESISGYTREEALGLSILDIAASEHRSSVAQRLAARISGTDMPPVEVQILAKDGRRIEVEVDTRLLMQDGKAIGVQGIARDVTERKRAVDLLRRSEVRFEKAFRSSPIAISITTLSEGRYLDANDSFLRLVGYSREDILGRTSLELGIWADPADRQRMVESLNQRQSVREMEMRLRAKGGQLHDTLASLEMIELGAECCVLGTIFDITQRLQLEAQLRHAQKMEVVGQLAASVAHDFNNLLTIIHGYSALLLSERNSPAEAGEALKQISEAAQRGSNLTRQLLAFSRHQVLQPEDLNVNDLIQNMDRMLLRVLGEDIALQINCAAHLPDVHADGGMLEQVILNLVVNARDAMPRGGLLVLRTEAVEVAADRARQNPEAAPGRHVCLTVSDTGTGMDAPTLARLFEPFFTTKEVGKGTGLGLATAYGIVKQHKGWMEVSSRAGAGSTFTLFLPALAVSRRKSAPATPPATAHAQGKETVLLVEDEEALRRLAAQVLQRNGYQVLQAGSGPEALDVWRHHAGTIDLLLTDMVMPGGMGGRELAERIKAEDTKVCVVYTSGYSLEAISRDSFLEAGVNFLAKPYRLRALTQVVRDSLDSRPASAPPSFRPVT